MYDLLSFRASRIYDLLSFRVREGNPDNPPTIYILKEKYLKIKLFY